MVDWVGPCGRNDEGRVPFFKAGIQAEMTYFSCFYELNGYQFISNYVSLLKISFKLILIAYKKLFF